MSETENPKTNKPMNNAEKAGYLSSMLATVEPKLHLVAPSGFDTKRFRQVMTDLLMATPQLLECAETPLGRKSFLTACTHIVTLGLDPSKIKKECYCVPFRNYKDKFTEAVVIVDARGFSKLARQSGLIEGISYATVYDTDVFSIELGANPTVIHKPDLDRPTWPRFWPQGETPEEKAQDLDCELNHVRGYYAVIGIENETPQIAWMNRAEMLKWMMRTRSKTREGVVIGPWADEHARMAWKTVLKQAFRHAPLSTQVSHAVALDDVIETGEALPARTDIAEDIAALAGAVESEAEAQTAPAASKSEELAEKLAKKTPPAAETQSPAAEPPAKATAEEAPQDGPAVAPEPQTAGNGQETANSDPAPTKEVASIAAQAPAKLPAAEVEPPVDLNRVVVTTDEGEKILRSNLDIARHFGCTDVRELTLQGLKAPNLTVLFEWCRQVAQDLGSLEAGLKMLKDKGITNWERALAWINPAAEVVETAPTLPESDPGLEQVIAEHALTGPLVDGWIRYMDPPPAMAHAYLTFLRQSGFSVQEHLDAHAQAKRTFDQAMELDGFEVGS